MAGSVSQKHLLERGQKDAFLYSALQDLNQKIRLSGGKIEDFSDVVAPTGLEPVTQGSSGLCSTN